MNRLIVSLLLALYWLMSAASPCLADEAHELEGRLLAPCCWRGTLDVHDSPLATALRREIRQRLAAGESAQAIEADLVARHGPRMRAALPQHLGYSLILALAAGGLGVLLWVRRLRRRAPAGPAPQQRPPTPEDLTPQERRALEDRLDDDLESAHGF